MADGSEPIKSDVVGNILRQADGAQSAPAGSDPAAPPVGGAGLDRAEIEALIKGNPAAGSPTTESSAAAAAAVRGPAAERTRAGSIAQGDIDLLLNQAEQALASIQSSARTGPPPGAAPFKLQDFNGAPASVENATLDLIRDIDLDLRIELGRTRMYLEDVLKLGKGAVVPLDKLAGDPVDIYANGRLIARGEVLILNDNFCVRVAELVAGETPPSQ